MGTFKLGQYVNSPKLGDGVVTTRHLDEDNMYPITVTFSSGDLETYTPLGHRLDSGGDRETNLTLVTPCVVSFFRIDANKLIQIADGELLQIYLADIRYVGLETVTLVTSKQIRMSESSCSKLKQFLIEEEVY